jgi:hypothetical protein
LGNSSSCPGSSSSTAQQRQQHSPGTSTAPGSSSPSSSPCHSAAGGVETASDTSPALWVRSCSQPGVTPTVASRLLLLSNQQCPVGLGLPQLGVSSGSINSRGYAAAAPTKLHPKQINSRISKATSPQQVEALVEQHAADMNSVNIATGYSRLSKLCRQRTTSAQAAAVQRALRALEPLVQQQQQSFGTWGLANIIHGFAGDASASCDVGCCNLEVCCGLPCRAVLCRHLCRHLCRSRSCDRHVVCHSGGSVYHQACCVF